MHIIHNSRKPYTTFEQDYLGWYHRTVDRSGQYFDPSSLVMLVRAQWTDGDELAEAFARCVAQWPESELYTHFLSPADMKRRWKFAGTRLLAHPDLGTLAVDLIHDPECVSGFSVGGIEYLDRVMGMHISVEELERTLAEARAMHARKFGDR